MNALKRIWRSITFTVDAQNPDALFKEDSASYCIWRIASRLIAVISILMILISLLSLIGKVTALTIGQNDWCPSYTNHTANIDSCDKKSWTSYFMCLIVWLVGCSLTSWLPIGITYLFIISIRTIYEIYLALKPLEEVILDQDDKHEYLSAFPRIRFMFSNKNDANLLHLIESNEVVDTRNYIVLNDGHAVKWGFHLFVWTVIIITVSLLAVFTVIVFFPGLGIISAKMVKMPILSCYSNTTLLTNDSLNCALVGLIEIFSAITIISLLICIFQSGQSCTKAIKSAEEIPLIKTKYAAELATGDNL